MTAVVPDLPADRRGHLPAIGLMMAGMLLLPCMDAIAKVLSTTYGVTAAQTTFARFLVQAVVLGGIIVLRHGAGRLRPRHVFVNLVRGAIMALAVMIFFSTLKTMPLADALAVFFTEPFILTILSAVLLGERIGWRRMAAVVVGFGGAMLVIRPGYAAFGPVAALPLATAVLFALYLIITRRFAPDDDPMAMQFVSGIGGAITIAAVMPFGTLLSLDGFGTAPLPAAPFAWLLLLGIGLIAAGGHLMVVHAFRRAPASLLAPFQYVEIITASLLGWLIFGDWPDAVRWLGIAIIVTSGLFLTWRESKAASA